MGAKRTPLPWRVSGTGHLCSGDMVIPFDDLKENAEFIVRACNSHYGLLEALELARKALSGSSWNAESYYVKSGEYAKDTSIIHAAIAKAKGE